MPLQDYLYYTVEDKKIILAALCCLGFLATNILTVKITDLGVFGLVTPSGVFIYPLSYVATHVLADAHGELTARKATVLSAIVSLIFVIVATFVMILPPASSVWDGQQAYEIIFAQSLRILISSYAAYITGSLIDARLTRIFKRRSKDGEIGYWSIFIIAFAQLCDITVFTVLGWAGSISFMDAFLMDMGQWAVMLLWTIIVQPITVRLIHWARVDSGIMLNS